jgi:hypothetical protein
MARVHMYQQSQTLDNAREFLFDTANNLLERKCLMRLIVI